MKMSRVEPQHTNYINLTAATWTALNSGATATYGVSPKGKSGRLFIANGTTSIIALSFDGGTTYHFFVPQNGLVDLGQTDPHALHARSATANTVSWWFVTD